MAAVQWNERLAESGDGERREFVRGERMVDIVNSTELRMADVRVQMIGIFQPLKANDDHARTKWELNGNDEADALPFLGAWCRLPVVLGAVVCVFPIQKLRGKTVIVKE